MQRVRFVNPQLHYARLKAEIDSAIIGCLTTGDLIYRKQLRDFEKELADFVGVKYAIGLASGYHALHLSMLGAGIKPGDEVITVAHTFVATVSAIVHCGAIPLLIDVGSDYNIDVNLLEKAITPRTKAIVVVHLNGRICDMDSVGTIAEKHGLIVIEDAAQALGATFRGKRAGSFGRAGCFSFYPFKILGGFGDGGAITTNDEQIAKIASLMRYNGEDRETGEYHYHGYTALLDNVQAAVLSAKLKHLPKWIEQRRDMATRYQRGLRDLAAVKLPHYDGDMYFDVFQNYVIRTRDRDRLRSFLRDNGVETLVHWPKPMWQHAALKLEDPKLPETEAICREAISLPMSAELAAEDVETVVRAIRQFFS